MVLFTSRVLSFGAPRFVNKPCILCQNRAFSLKEDAEKKADDRETHFGFETVKESEKTRKVSEVFHRVADTYDLMNDVMSVGIHRLWKDVFVERLSPPAGTKLLDVAGGTGDIAFRFANYLKNAGQTGSVTVCDINPDMLRVGQDRARQKNYTDINWVEGNAEELPFPDNSFTAYTVAFGLRNVTRTDMALKEAWRVLKPGGRFMCLEFSHVENEPLRWLYDRYSFQMIPAMGQVIAGDWKSYQYLVESIRKFPDQETLAGMIESAGFWAVSYENLTFGAEGATGGWGPEVCRADCPIGPLRKNKAPFTGVAHGGAGAGSGLTFRPTHKDDGVETLLAESRGAFDIVTERAGVLCSLANQF